MYLLLYNIALLGFRAGVRIAALVNPKARLWVEGRKGIFARIKKSIGTTDKIIWFHCASLGEFEQGRPVLESVRKKYPDHKILLTFFSPSGYEVRKQFPGADYIFYLPVDSASNAKRFLKATHPALVIFVKYEFWYHYLTAIRKQSIPLLLISAVFRDTQPFFQWYGGLHRKMLQQFTHLFVQDPDSEKLLGGIQLKEEVSVAGDTRFDRVSEIANQFEAIPIIETFCGSNNVIVAGSTWPDDEKALKSALEASQDRSACLILVPHEIGTDHISQLKGLFPTAIFYTELIAQTPGNSGLRSDAGAGLINPDAGQQSILIIDQIGLLSRLYHYATICYIGGGFSRDGIHNVLEAAVYDKALIFGPVYQKYREAVELIALGAAKTFSDADSLKEFIDTLLQDRKLRSEMGIAAGSYISGNKGASRKITAFIQEKRLLTS